MDINLFLYLQAAKALKLPMEYSEELAGVSVKLAGDIYYFRQGYTPFNIGSSDNLALNKYSVHHLFRKAGFPVPRATAVCIEDRINGAWSLPKLIYPIVAKPTVDTGWGEDVLCNIKNEQMLIEYLNEFALKHEFISLETFEQGLTAYRVIVFFNKVIAVAQLDPACVIGDGKHTIIQLIDIENKRRTNIESLTNIRVDQECKIRLDEMNITLDYIPKINEKIILCYTCNTSRGGTMVSLGQSICPENADLLFRAAKELNLNLVGFDIVCEDIQQPIKKSRGFIIEANSNPDLELNEMPVEGVCVPMAKIFLKQLIKNHPVAYLFNYLKIMLLSLFSKYEKSILRNA
jgi:glutathione synthase/RimK-type ligase-like ATP-grasp enzyme